jgi:hypothetical protein
LLFVHAVIYRFACSAARRVVIDVVSGSLLES